MSNELQVLEAKHKNLYVLQFDVTDFANHKEFAEQVNAIVKDNGLNVLFNNAGVSPKYTRLQYVKPEQLMDTYKTNTVAPIILAKTLLPILKQAADKNADKPFGINRAAIVNMSSILGSVAMNTDGGLYPYKCSKAALNQATTSMMIDLKNDGIMSVALHPGWVKTDLGGTKAPMDIDTSTGSLLNFLYAMNETHNGGFYQWDGKALPY